MPGGSGGHRQGVAETPCPPTSSQFLTQQGSMSNIYEFNPPIDLEKNGKTVAPTINNFRNIMRANGIWIRYNEIRKEIQVTIPDKEFLPDNYLNCCVAYITSLCEQHKMPTKHVLKFMLILADEHKINPIKDWIEGKVWDRKSRLNEFYATITSVDEVLKVSLLKRWMLSAIAALYEPEGVSAGGMLVLLGKQYMGKTNWFKNLVSEDVKQYIQDGMSVDPHQRDTFMACLENWLVELGEIDATFKRADLAALKSFINRQRDTARLAYASSNSRFPRRTVFFGSVDKHSYLTDPAGNRRFWTIECTDINHTHGINMQQVWAEFYEMYLAGEKWLLSKEEHERLSISNKEYEAVNPMEERILNKYNWDYPNSNWKTATEILEELGYKNISNSEATTCALLIRKLNGNVSKRTNSARLLALPPTNNPAYGTNLWGNE